MSLKVTIPTKITERQKEILKEFAEEDKKHAPSSNTSHGSFSIIDEAWKRLKEYLGKNSKAENAGKKGEQSA